MKIFSVTALMISCLAFCVGLFYLLIFIRRRNEKEKLHFALGCFFIALYDVFCAGLYNASSIQQGIFWQRLQFAALLLFAVAIIWFIYHLSGAKSSRIEKAFTWCAMVLLIAGLAIRNEWTLSLNKLSIKQFNLGPFDNITYYEATPGLIYTIQMIMLLLAYIWIFVRLKNISFEHNKKIWPVRISFILFFVAVINDIAVSTGLYRFIYLAEYLYLAIILSMAYVLLDHFVNVQFELENLNFTLEKKVEKKTDELRAAMEELEAINDALIYSNRELEQAQAIASLDMSMAATVQKKIFTKEVPKLDDWDIAYCFRPAKGISGDLYDFYITNDLLEGIALFDVSGHGISAGLFTLLARSILFRNFSQLKKHDLDIVIETINGELQEEIKDVDNYLSGVLFRFSEDRVEYVNAAHPEPLLKKQGSPFCGPLLPENKSLNGSLLGLNDINNPFEVYEFSMEKDDILLLFTDGAVENINSKNEQYGTQRLADALSRAPGHGAAEMVKYITGDIFSFTGSDQLPDDMTIIIVRKT
ncbi:MAG TPA: SpoIIE family protein phosphatase [Spirochaetota bacterium]|nr:SpoIIE family protein phosphatase [Spirochaetota bacterium]HPI90430.1 SpoIIE family protein phosphatase [Spirochaetota bacterium]HPR46556.1 SpoIIE family protein phosphatase [Spirochaetota bacterium]